MSVNRKIARMLSRKSQHVEITTCVQQFQQMAAVLLRTVRLRVPAGAAKPGPAIGQALGPLGLNMAEFCKQFNERTKGHVKETPVPVILSAFNNRTFTFVIKTPPTSYLIKQCIGLEKGSARSLKFFLPFLLPPS